MNGGGAPSQRHLTVARLVERLTRALFDPGKLAERLFDCPDACAAMNRWHRQIGLAQAVGHDATRKQHFLAGTHAPGTKQCQFRLPDRNNPSEITPNARVEFRAA